MCGWCTVICVGGVLSYVVVVVLVGCVVCKTINVCTYDVPTMMIRITIMIRL